MFRTIPWSINLLCKDGETEALRLSEMINLHIQEETQPTVLDSRSYLKSRGLKIKKKKSSIINAILAYQRLFGTIVRRKKMNS